MVLAIYQPHYSSPLTLLLSMLTFLMVHGPGICNRIISGRMPNAVTFQVRVYLSFAAGTFWFDDIILDRGAVKQNILSPRPSVDAPQLYTEQLSYHCICQDKMVSITGCQKWKRYL